MSKMARTLAVSYLNGLLELTVTDDPGVPVSDYDVLDGVPGLEVARAESDGQVLHRGEIISLLALRFHERGPRITHGLKLLGLPNVYDVPSQGLFGKTLAEAFQALYADLVARPKFTTLTLPQKRPVKLARVPLPA